MATEDTNTRSGLFLGAEPIARVRHRHELNLSPGDDKGDTRDDASNDAGMDDAGADDSGRDDSGSDDAGDDKGDTKDDSGGDDSGRDDR